VAFYKIISESNIRGVKFLLLVIYVMQWHCCWCHKNDRTELH